VKSKTQGFAVSAFLAQGHNAYLVNLDGDGDRDIATTEENGGRGVIWFENPAKN